MSNTIQESVDRNKKEKIESFKQTASVDSAKIKTLEKFFKIKSDEFSNDNKKWYKPKTSLNYTNTNHERKQRQGYLFRKRKETDNDKENGNSERSDCNYCSEY